MSSFIICDKIFQCSFNFLGKHRSKHDQSTIDPNLDVGHVYRINKVTDRTADLEDAAYVFNR